MDITSPYEPNDWQIKFHSEEWRYSACVGGKGTTDVDSRIYDADLEAYVSIRWLLEKKRRPCVLSWTDSGWRKIWASSPYFEGIGPMHKVTLVSGKSIFVSSGHRFLTQKGFLQTLDLSESDFVFCPRNLHSKFQNDVAYAPSARQIALDLTDDYWKGLGQYDGRLLSQLEVAQEFFPLSYDLFCRNDSFLVGSFQRCLYHKRDSIPLSGILAESDRLRFFYYAGSDELVRPDKEALKLFEFDERSTQDWREILSHKGVDLKPTAYCPNEKDNIQWSYLNRAYGPREFCDRTLNDGKSPSPTYAHSADPQFVSYLNSELYSDNNCYSLSSPHLLEEGNTSYMDQVKSVEYIGHRAYFDLHVPGANNYVAEGMVHHNSGKTRSAVEELLACAIEVPGTTYLISRKTGPSLVNSTWKEVKKVVPAKLIKRITNKPLHIELINGSEFLGLSLDEEKKFDSMEISGFFIDEAEEIEEVMFKTLKDRVRQICTMPDGRKVMPRYRGILGLNPTEEDHWIAEYFLSESLPKDHKLYFSSTMDNLQNLPPDYLDQLKQNYMPDMQKRMIYGQFGKVHKGRPVFPQFARGHYIWDIKADPKTTMFRCWDFGYNRPACLWFQWDNGQMRVLAEKMGKKIYLEQFVRECLKYEEELFPHNKIYKDFCDPRGSDESDKGVTSIQILNELDIYPSYRRITIKEGVKNVRQLMDTKNANGEPNFQIHRRCQVLVEALRGGYHRLDGHEDPNKDGYYDHLVDTLRYGASFMVRRYNMNVMQKKIAESERVIYTRGGRRIEL